MPARLRAGARPASSCWASTATHEPWSLDNERPAHVGRPAGVPDRAGAGHQRASGSAFVDAGGYDQPRWWSRRGWAHRVEAGLERPLFWSADGSPAPVRHRRGDPARRAGAARLLLRGRGLRRLGRRAAAHRAGVGEGLRLGPGLGRRRRWPWGDSELDARPGQPRRRRRCGPAPVGAYPAGASAYGVEQLIGDVWEWTSSAFEPWPGFAPMLYADYSAPFFGGDFRVLRGGSWAVGGALDPAVVPQLGPADPPADLLRRCGWPGTPDVPAPGLAGRAAHRRRAGPRARRTGCCGSPTRRAGSGAACSTPTAGASGFYAAGRRRAGRAGARPGRCGATRRSPRWRRCCASACVLAAVRSATVGHADGRERAPRRSPTGAGCSRTTAGSTARCCRSTATPSRSCDSALLAAHVFARGPDRLGADGPEVAGRDPAARAEPAAHRRRPAPRRRPGATR